MLPRIGELYFSSSAVHVAKTSDVFGLYLPHTPITTTMPNNTSDTTRIVVLGCGVIGLTTAVRLLESFTAPKAFGSRKRVDKVEVHIVADHFPDDPLDARYASTAAGAHHLSFADDNDWRQRRWDSRSEFELV